jgi:hypothetical protein
MTKAKIEDIIKSCLAILIGVLAIWAIKSIFENDNSKIVSKKGKRFLSDDKKMQDINEKIHDSEIQNQHHEIIV